MPSNFYSVDEKAIRWNWGAFCNPVVFGVANKTYKTVLAFLPCLIPCLTAILWVNKIVPLFVFLASLPLLFAWNVSCGLFAERWVWATGQYEDGMTFRAVMDTWNRAGMFRAIIFLINLIITALVVALVLYFARDAMVSFFGAIQG